MLIHGLNWLLIFLQTGKKMKSDEIFGMRDLANRWGFKTVSGVRKRQKYDKAFPKPWARINNQRILIFSKTDIENYEKLRAGIDNKRGYTFNQSKEEWQMKSKAEMELQRGAKYLNDF